MFSGKSGRVKGKELKEAPTVTRDSEFRAVTEDVKKEFETFKAESVLGFERLESLITKLSKAAEAT